MKHVCIARTSLFNSKNVRKQHIYVESWYCKNLASRFPDWDFTHLSPENVQNQHFYIESLYGENLAFRFPVYMKEDKHIKKWWHSICMTRRKNACTSILWHRCLILWLLRIMALRGWQLCLAVSRRANWHIYQKTDRKYRETFFIWQDLASCDCLLIETCRQWWHSILSSSRFNIYPSEPQI